MPAQRCTGLASNVFWTYTLDWVSFQHMKHIQMKASNVSSAQLQAARRLPASEFMCLEGDPASDLPCIQIKWTSGDACT